MESLDALAGDRSTVPPDVQEVLQRVLAGGVVIAGRRFVHVTTLTFEHRQHVLDRIERAGIMPLVRTIPDDPDRLAAAMVLTASRSGQLFAILAGLLVTDGDSWTAETAAANARCFASTTDPAESDRLVEVFLWLVLDFFLASAGSSRIFLRFLVGAAETESPAARSASSAAAPAPSSSDGGVTPTSATSPSSFARSRITAA